MTDRERLEIIKFLRNSEKTVAPGMQPSELISRKDVDWLINRVEELEKQIKRYRKALEFYADEETYEMKFVANTDEIGVPLTVIELDEGKKARQALEGEN